MLNLRLEEIIIVICFSVLHLGLYHYTAQLSVPKPKAIPILIELIHPKPKPPEPKVIKPEPKPKPKVIDAPPKPIELPKLQKPKPLKPVKPKKVVKNPEVKKVIEKPRLQQESIVKVHAEAVVEKEIAIHTQPLSEPDVKEPDNKPEVKAEPIDSPEPVHEPVFSNAKYEGSPLNEYPVEAREQGLEGTVKIKIQVLEDGCMGNASIVKSSGSDLLDNAALENISKCGFQPKTKDGVPIKSSVILPVRFKLN